LKLIVNPNIDVDYNLKYFDLEKWHEIFSSIIRNLYKNEWSVKTFAYAVLFQDNDIEFNDLNENKEKKQYIDKYIIPAFKLLFTSKITFYYEANETAGTNLMIVYKEPI